VKTEFNMELFFVFAVFVMVVIGCTWVGSKLIARATRESKARPIPPARLANLEGTDALYAKAASVAARAPRKIGKGIAVTLGLGLIAAPWAFVYMLLRGLSDLDMTKGRVLRIRNRARLPELATGEGWTAQPISLQIDLPAAERAVLGELWLLTARMEHASVAAFSQLSLHLSALGAPARLLAATHRAALEEIAHAQQCFAITAAITGVPHSAGPIAALGDGGGPPIDLTRLAIGSLIDGCLGEGIAADVAGHGALAANEPAIRETLAMIAREETGHAELAWDVLSWCLDIGDDAVRTAVATRVEALAKEVTPRLPSTIRDIDERVLAAYGVIDQDTLGEIAAARIAAVQKRARTLVSAPAALRRAA
jgi:hypothetical protein